MGTETTPASSGRKGFTAFDGFMTFNALLLIGSTAYAYATAELEFGLYAAVILTMGLLAWRILRRYHYPLWMLALLQMAVFAHFAGGFTQIPPDGHSLYYHDVLGIRYDKIVHFCNSALIAVVLMSIFRQAKMRLKPMEGLIIIGVVTGLGAAIEILEYFAVMTIPNTGVGDYANTVEDLIMNLVGAIAGYAVFRIAETLTGRQAESGSSQT